jgi:Zn-dependent peptidase ImmA (M78 family)
MSAIYARRLLEKYEVQEAKDLDLQRIAQDLDITIEEDDLEGCDGMLQMVAEPKCGIITVKSSIREPGQKRFIIGHEIGHFETPARPGLGYHCASADLSLSNQRIKPEERAANEFAAELLMPERLFVPRLVRQSPRMDLIKDLAADFKTTLTATLRRFIEFTENRCALVCSENSKVKYCVPSKEFGFRIAHGRPLDKNSFAIDYFEQGNIDERIQSVLASAWVKNSRIDQSACIKEHSIAQPNYNSVLTLLWIDEDIDGRYSVEDEEEQEADLDHFTPDGKRWRW